MRHRSEHRGRTTHADQDQSPIDDLENEMLAPVRAASPVAVRQPARSFIVEDRRRWAPGSPGLSNREQPRDGVGRAARVKMQSTPSTKAMMPVGVAKRRWSLGSTVLSREQPVFLAPRSLTICLQRKIRREVLFANGRYKKASKKRRRNEWSNVKCSTF